MKAVSEKTPPKRTRTNIPAELADTLAPMSEACDTLDCSRWSVYRLIRKGLLKGGPTLGRTATVTRQSLKAHVQRIKRQIT